ncbi:Y-family DNA polymerase [Sphingobacterium paucimobilis]|nr:DNA polymerase Y family protein [Sphingobacterium paucimobilis]
MPRRYMCIWLPFFGTDRAEKEQPERRKAPFVLTLAQNGRVKIQAANRPALQEGISCGMVLADAQAILPQLESAIYDANSLNQTLQALGEWCIRFAPIVDLQAPDGIVLDISGCAHLWGGEEKYGNHIIDRIAQGGYQAQAAIADTIGTAWAVARHTQRLTIVSTAQQAQALSGLPPAALRISLQTQQRLHKLGFRYIEEFMHIPKSTLRRRFGDELICRLGQALGTEQEHISPIEPIPSYQERLSCLDPISTSTGIQIALERLLTTLCDRLRKEEKGLRQAVFRGYRIDGNVQTIHIGTGRASSNPTHLFKLFDLKVPNIEPALGIELFVLEATLIENSILPQEGLWQTKGGQSEIAELLDNIAAKIGSGSIHRFLPSAHHWPERTIEPTSSLDTQPQSDWPRHALRPLHLLAHPEPIEVMVPLPDYPPALFRHRKKIYKLVKADGPERIEQEWWISDEQPRDYYRVEDEKGARYWLFRSGYYGQGDPEWFLHGYFT